MISVDNRKFLYSQLEVIAKDSSAKSPLISLELFLAKDDVQLIKYIFEFRKTHIVMIDGEKVEPYFELPDMDLSGLDLSEVEFAAFVPGIIKDGTIIKSKINLSNTNAIVNISRIYNTDIIDHNGYREYVTDLSNCDFRGCRIYGRTQEEIKKGKKDKDKYTFIGKEVLDDRYLKRRACHSGIPTSVAEEVYANLIDGRTISHINENEEIDLTDYDFSNFSPSEITFIKNQLYRRKILIGFSGLEKNKLGSETPESLERTIKDAIKSEDNTTVRDYADRFSGAKLSYLVDYLVERRMLTSRNVTNYITDRNMIEKVINGDFVRKPKTVPTSMYRYVKTEYLVAAVGVDKTLDEKIIGYLQTTNDSLDNVAKKILEREDKDIISSILKTRRVKNVDTIIAIAEKHGIDIVPEELRTQTFYSKLILNSLNEKENKKAKKKSRIREPLMYLDKADLEVAEKVLDAEYKAGREKYLKMFFKLAKEQTRVSYMKQKIEESDSEFVEKNLVHIPIEVIDYVFKLAFDMDAQMAKRAFGKIGISRQNRIVESILSNKDSSAEKIDFVWAFASARAKERAINEAERSKNRTFLEKVNGSLTEKDKIQLGILTKKEAKAFISQGKPSKKFVELMRGDCSITSLKRLIEAGIDIDATVCLKGTRPQRIIEYAAKLMSFLRREEIMYELLKANVNVDFFVDWRNRNGEGFKGRFKDSNIFKSLPHHLFVRRFLEEELNFTADEINKLNAFYKGYDIDFKALDFKELNLKKMIFDYCGVTNYAFRENQKLLLTASETYYSRLMFFRDCGIDVDDKNFMKTLGLTNAQFAKEYGRMIAIKGNKDNKEYDTLVRKTLVAKYPIPISPVRLDKKIGEEKMIYIKEDRKNGNKVHVFSKENEFSFENSRVLPAEQRDLLLEMLEKMAKRNKGNLDEEYEMQERERIAGEMLKRLQDARLSKKARITTLYSGGGSLTSGTEKEKDAMKSKGAKVEYLVIDINGMIILEPFGQLNNATFVAMAEKGIERRLVEFGRKGVLDQGFYKVMHVKGGKPGYNYESDHILKILDMTIEDRDTLLKVLKNVRDVDGNQYCALNKVKRNYHTVRASKDVGLTKAEVLAVGKEIELPDDKKGDAR